MSDDIFIEDLQLTKQFVMKELARTGNYAVVEPGKDAIYINKVDAKMPFKIYKQQFFYEGSDR